MRPLSLLTVLIVARTLQSQVRAEQTQNCDDGEALDVDCELCGPNYFLGPGGQCQQCSVCTDRVVASECTSANDTICGSCAAGYFETGHRCVKCLLEPHNPACSPEKTTTPWKQVAVTEQTGPYNADQSPSVKSAPEMGITVIYVVLLLSVVLIGSLLILCCIVFCPLKKKKPNARQDHGRPNNAANDNDDYRLGEGPAELIPMVEQDGPPEQHRDEAVAQGDTSGQVQLSQLGNGNARAQAILEPDHHGEQCSHEEPNYVEPSPSSRITHAQHKPPPGQTSVININNAQWVVLNGSVAQQPRPNLVQNPQTPGFQSQQPQSNSYPDESEQIFVNPDFDSSPDWHMNPGPAQPLQRDESREQQVYNHHRHPV